MAIELRHRARTAERTEPIDPSQTGPRTRLPESSSIDARVDSDRPHADRPHAERHSASPDRPSAVPARRARVTRPSMRPSAFGMPRSSAPPGSAHATEGAPRSPEHAGAARAREDVRLTAPLSRRDSAPPQVSAAALLASTEPADDVPVSSQIIAKRPRLGTASGSARPPESGLRASARSPEGTPRAAIKTDIEELLPISQGVKSLPRPPRLPSFEAAQQPGPAPRRFPWASLAVFAVALMASLAPLFHYRVESNQSEPRAARTAANVVQGASTTSAPLIGNTAAVTGVVGEVVRPVPVVTQALGATPAALTTPTAAERIERAFWGQPNRVQQALLAEGERALQADDERLAETLFARALDFSADDAQGAYGLARVRLAQGDLDGAEGWVVTAIKQRPRRGEYRALHAEILQRFGRGAEAQLERALARSLPRTAPHFPAATRSR